MATPHENTEVVNLLRDVKNSIWKSVTPLKVVDRRFTDYKSNLKGPGSLFQPPQISARLNFSGLDDSSIFSDSSSSAFKPLQTPESLKRKLMCTEVELQASIAKVKERESQISVLEPAHKKICMDLENKLEERRRQTEFDAQKIEELQTQLHWATKQVAALKNQVAEAERFKKTDSNQQEMKILGLHEECCKLKLEMADVKSEKMEVVRKLNLQIGRLEMKISELTNETEISQRHVKNYKNQVSEMTEKVSRFNHLENMLNSAQETIKKLENEIEANKESALIVSSQHNDLKTLSDLQKENLILKEEASKYKENNIMLYQEKVWSLQEKLTQSEKKCAFAVKLQVENEQLKAKLGQWEELFDEKATPFKSPTAFSRKLSQYQQKEVMLTNQLSQKSSQCEMLEKQKAEQCEMVLSLKKKLEDLQENYTGREQILKRMQRKIMFLSKEKDNCRKLLDSYLSESTVSGMAINVVQICHLEEMNMEYKRALEKSEKEFDNLHLKLRSIEQASTSQDCNSELSKLREENAKHIAKITELEHETANLKTKCTEAKVVCKERVLHLRMNPLEAAHQRHLEEFRSMRAENDVLKKRVAVLEEEGAAASDVTIKVRDRLQSEGAESTLQSLRDQLSAAERKQRFILESARVKSRELREAVYRLTGYRVDVPSAKTFKLSHLYAESKDDFLLFTVDSGGVQLVESEYSQQLSEKVELYLHQHDSFPAFLAALTLHLFNQQTFMASSQ